MIIQRRKNPKARAVGISRGGITAVLLTVCVLLTGCHSKDYVPGPSSRSYEPFLAAFYQGVAGLQVGDDVRAESSLAEAVKLAPGEPAAWVDWGILALRQRTYDTASTRFDRAHVLAPRNAQIEYLQGLLESERGNSAASIAHLQQATHLDPRNLRALYQLASEVERQGDATSDQQYQQIIEQILTVEPGNLAALLDLGRIAAKRNDTATLRAAVAKIAAQGSGWPQEAAQQLAQFQSAAAGQEPRSAATRSIFLRNVLMRVSAFRNDLSALKPQPGEGAEPMMHLLRAQNPASQPAPPDLALKFTPELRPGDTRGSTWAGAIDLNGTDAPVLAEADYRHLHLENGPILAFPGGNVPKPLSPESILPIDFNYDFKTDLVLAGAGGVRFYRQENPSSFTDVTAATRLPPSILHASYSGAWALDIEADGDLDVLLGSDSSAPILLRNNGDGTFAVTNPFDRLSGVKQLVWADLNYDGNPDAAILDGANHLHIFLNQRSGVFAEAAAPFAGQVKAITAADVGMADKLSLLAITAAGSVEQISFGNAQNNWQTKSIAQVPNATAALAGEVRFYAADIDNNGAVDLLLSPIDSTTSVHPILWLQDQSGFFTLCPVALHPDRIFSVADIHHDGRLAFIGLDTSGIFSVAANQGSKNYHWQTIHPRARVSTGDQRINSFGIGGEIEIRAGLLTQKQPMNSPTLHFGLGDQKIVDVARILWPNGTVRAEFNLQPNQQIVTEQRLKGSCPFLFAWDGQRFSFVKDSVPWGSAIGLRINALGTADIAATEEWFKIAGDQLQARDGFYDLRVTGELWETYYYDSLALMTVDHPADTEIFTDERYDVPPVKLAITAVSKPQPIFRALDDSGRDVTAVLSKLDGNYLDNFGRGQYQGITRDHYVEIDLPDSLPTNTPLWLIAIGWLHPSDSSINVAISQGHAEQPRWLSLEVPDSTGAWHVAKPNLGFPAGRNKTCLIDLSGLFPAGTPHRLRLRTNLEVYWDQIEWAEGQPAAQLKIDRLSPSVADLRYRGFSTIHQASASSPELPDYNHLSGTSQRWRDLEGYYTRFGDVRALLASPDDRYVIMNAGDELSLRFAVTPPPPPGWVRDYAIAGDGWIKDGDYNSSYSQTVLPYPYHARKNYSQPPTILDKDWVYQHHKQDWQTYQTRYITADSFKNGVPAGVSK